MPPPQSRVLEVDGPALLALALSIAAVVSALGLARSIPRTLAALAVASLLAVGFDPLVTLVERKARASRGVALAAVFGTFALAVAGLAVALVPSAAAQVRDLDDDIPAAIDELTSLPVVGDDIERADLPARIERIVDELPGRLTGKGTPIVNIARRAADGAVAAVATVLIAMALALDGRRLLALAGAALPERHRATARRATDVAYRAVGRYVAGSLAVAVVAGVFTLAVGLVLGVPLAPLLALWVMVWDLVPQVGGAAGGIPFVVLAFTQGAVPGLLAAALFVGYLQIENNVLAPLLVGSAVKLSPLATMTAALVGVSAGGVVGALLAVPLTGAVKAVYLELREGATARR